MRYLRFIILITALLSLSNCEKDAEVQPKEYPFISMQETKVNLKGVEFVGKITNLGDLSIKKHGFIWYKGSTIDSANYFSRTINTPAIVGSFFLSVHSDLQKNEVYTVRPFVKTENYTVLGNSMSFLSQGSLQPIIEDFFPKSGNTGDTITITGSNFSLSKNRTDVLIGKDQAIVISADFQEIKFILPSRLSVSGEVQLTLTSGENSLTGNELFHITGHQISNFSPSLGFIGESEIIISGSGFQNSRNQVRIGGFSAIILKESEEELRVRLPYTMEVGEASVEVEIDGKIAIADNFFNVESRWSELKSFPGESRVGGYFEVINDHGFLICGSQKPVCCDSDFDEVWRYDFTSDQWENIGSFPGTARSMATGLLINGQIYYGMGVHNFARLSDFWRYNPESQEWSQLGDFPGDLRYDVIQFVLNNKGYIIGGRGSWNSREVWEFDPNKNYWEQLGFISFNISTDLDGRDVFLQTDTKAYLIPITFSETSSYLLYEFDPTNPNFLTEVTEIPFNIYRGDRLTGFIINDEIYVGGGNNHYNTDENPEFWKYNISTNNWVRIESFLGGETTLVNSFTKGDYGYIFFDKNNTLNCNDLWRYDPKK